MSSFPSSLTISMSILKGHLIRACHDVRFVYLRSASSEVLLALVGPSPPRSITLCPSTPFVCHGTYHRLFNWPVCLLIFCLSPQTVSSSPREEGDTVPVLTDLGTCSGWLPLSKQRGSCRYTTWMTNMNCTVRACQLTTVMKLLIES